MDAHGDDAIADNDSAYPICAIECSQRASNTRPMARSVNIVPAPGAGSARV
ncbi:hypothetical protein LMG24076_05409 [Trinickia soli]|nr:hypothetical protein LMG24076_05409 [Trinickia soli]